MTSRYPECAIGGYKPRVKLWCSVCQHIGVEVVAEFYLSDLTNIMEPWDQLQETLRSMGYPDIRYPLNERVPYNEMQFREMVIRSIPSLRDTYNNPQLSLDFSRVRFIITKFYVIVGDAFVENIVGDFNFLEGPVWVPDGHLLFSDIPANIIYKWTPGSESADVFHDPSGHSNGLALDKEGCLLVCEHDGRVCRIEDDGRVVAIAERYQEKRLNSPNDIVVKSDGVIYFTDPPYGLTNQDEDRELEINGVYCISLDGTLVLLDDTFERPNGLAFSPDEMILYVNDSSRGHIRAFDVQEDGTLSNGRLFAMLEGPGEGVPDGMKVDIRGNVFCTGPGGIWVFDCAAEQLGVIMVPEVPSNLAWGDDDLKTLYITARSGLYKMRTKTGGMRAG